MKLTLEQEVYIKEAIADYNRKVSEYSQGIMKHVSYEQVVQNIENRVDYNSVIKTLTRGTSDSFKPKRYGESFISEQALYEARKQNRRENAEKKRRQEILSRHDLSQSELAELKYNNKVNQKTSSLRLTRLQKDYWRSNRSNRLLTRDLALFENYKISIKKSLPVDLADKVLEKLTEITPKQFWEMYATGQLMEIGYNYHTADARLDEPEEYMEQAYELYTDIISVIEEFQNRVG